MTSTNELKRRCPLVGCVCFIIFAILGILCLGIGILFYCKFDTIFGDVVKQQMIINNNNLWWYEHWLKPSGREILTVHVFEIENVNELRQNWLETLTAPKLTENQKKKPKEIPSSSSTTTRIKSLNRNSKQEKDIATVVNRLQPQIREVGPFVFRIERLKENVIFANDEKNQAGYNERVQYHFDQLLSYEDIDQKVIVVNSELSALNPFVRALMKRGENVKKISNGLRNVIDEILNLYAMNIFVERPIWRIIFGPNYQSDHQQNNIDNGDGDQDINANMNELDENDETIDINNKNSTKESNTTNIEHTKYTNDETVGKILTLYDKAEQYIKRLGVDIDPYDLLAGIYRYENVVKSGPKLIKLKEKKMKLSRNEYRQNSVFSFFSNNSIEKYDIYTGINDEQNGEIIAWNQHSYMDAWYGRQCNSINGTDGRQYSPFVRESRIYQFIPRLCRSIPFTLSKLDIISSPSGISLRRFSEANDFMQSPFRNKANGCFCRFQNQLKRCNYDGILDMANCYNGAPIILTRPHFSGTITKSIGRSINGLVPDDQFYQTYIDVEPISGIVLDKMERYQLNVHFPPLPLKLNANRTIPETIIPLFWYQEQFVASQDYHNHLKYYFIYPMKYQEYGVLSLISFGLLLLFISFVCIGFGCFTRIPVKNNNTTIIKQTEQLNDLKNRKLLSPSIEPLMKKPIYDANVEQESQSQQQQQQQQSQPPIYGIMSRMEPIMHPIHMSNMKLNNAATIISNKIHNLHNNIRQQQPPPQTMSDVKIISNNNNVNQSDHIYSMNTDIDRNLARRMIEMFSDEFDHGQSTVNHSNTTTTTPENMMITPVDSLNDQSPMPISRIPLQKQSSKVNNTNRQSTTMIRPTSKVKRQQFINNNNNLTKNIPSTIHLYGPYSSLPTTPEHYREIQSQGSMPIASSPSIGTIHSSRSMIVSNPLPPQSSLKQQQKNLHSLIRSSHISDSDSGFFQKPDSSSSDIFIINQTDEKFKDFSNMKRRSVSVSASKQSHIDNDDDNNQMDEFEQNTNYMTNDNNEQITENLSKLNKHMKNLMKDSIIDENNDDDNDKVFDDIDNDDNNNEEDINDDDDEEEEIEKKDRPTLAGVYQLINFARPSWPTRNDILEEIKQRSLELKNSKK
ncbi:uncharacterized protein LOC113796527 isoform X1 [Dermatophagoides pteronyssinus]|uniref:uncharacterized protein LOC113796527 isoform X1 n=1 Tax=Dermatophagoides pteronyssinus TaxID=6956 RepID=UPI003F662E97